MDDTTTEVSDRLSIGSTRPKGDEFPPPDPQAEIVKRIDRIIELLEERRGRFST